MEGRSAGQQNALSEKSPAGGWQPPLLQPTTGDNNSEMHPMAGRGPFAPCLSHSAKYSLASMIVAGARLVLQ